MHEQNATQPANEVAKADYPRSYLYDTATATRIHQLLQRQRRRFESAEKPDQRIEFTLIPISSRQEITKELIPADESQKTCPGTRKYRAVPRSILVIIANQAEHNRIAWFLKEAHLYSPAEKSYHFQPLFNY